jgi:hypothetical protein
MMQSAQDRATGNASGCLGGARCAGASLFNDKCARAVVLAHVRQQHVTQMAFAKYRDMVNAFPADRTDQPFGVGVLPR